MDIPRFIRINESRRTSIRQHQLIRHFNRCVPIFEQFTKHKIVLQQLERHIAALSRRFNDSKYLDQQSECWVHRQCGYSESRKEKLGRNDFAGDCEPYEVEELSE
ncbi:hypothetical protein PVK06_023086 [Gossypium arboreum]|uniref:Uncharacterized protein n=1 Tax=Gossypium arboreum TaxID=29729 RepID=A0ABR0PAA4_GOSAR|nr:hypothetical protein PVK06_023086 [Gossypium arboreum]